MRISKSTKTSVKASKSSELLDIDSVAKKIAGEISGGVDPKFAFERITYNLCKKGIMLSGKQGEQIYNKVCDIIGNDDFISDWGYNPTRQVWREWVDSEVLADDIDACGDIKGSTSTDKALQHIKAAIDILGKSGKKDAVTKDSIANLGVVMFDLKGEEE